MNIPNLRFSNRVVAQAKFLLRAWYIYSIEMLVQHWLDICLGEIWQLVEAVISPSSLKLHNDCNDG